LWRRRRRGRGSRPTTQAATTGGGGPPQTLQLQADQSGALRFTTDSLQANAGEVTIVMENASSLPHNISLKGGGVDERGEIVGKGERSEVTATVQPGTYEFYCSVPGHEAAGMKGELTVS